MIEDDDVCLDDFTLSVSKAAIKAALQSGPLCHFAKIRKKGRPMACVISFENELVVNLCILGRANMCLLIAQRC